MKNIKWHMDRIDYLDYIEADDDSIRNCHIYLGMHLGLVKQRLMRRGFTAQQADSLLHKRRCDYEGCWGPERYQEPGHFRAARFEPGGDLFIGPCFEDAPAWGW